MSYGTRMTTTYRMISAIPLFPCKATSGGWRFRLRTCEFPGSTTTCSSSSSQSHLQCTAFCCRPQTSSAFQQGAHTQLPIIFGFRGAGRPPSVHFLFLRLTASCLPHYRCVTLHTTPVFFQKEMISPGPGSQVPLDSAQTLFISIPLLAKRASELMCSKMQRSWPQPKFCAMGHTRNRFSDEMIFLMLKHQLSCSKLLLNFYWRRAHFV